jgi:hypothetical protein
LRRDVVSGGEYGAAGNDDGSRARTGRRHTNVMIIICDREGIFVESARRTIVRIMAMKMRMHCVTWRKSLKRGF